MLVGHNPSVETLGYSHPSLRDEDVPILVVLDILIRFELMRKGELADKDVRAPVLSPSCS
jgi:hypothetical protein